MIEGVFRFGDCELRLASRELLCNERPVELQPQVFKFLVYLIQNPDRVVTKDELLDNVWGKRFVTESVIARTAMKARKAIGDDADQPRFIVTQHGYGYRFVAKVEPVVGPPTPVVAADAVTATPAPDTPLLPTVDSRQRDRRAAVKRMSILSVIAGLIILAIVIMLLPREGASTGSPRLAVLPLKNATGEASFGWIELGMMSLLGEGVRSRIYVDLIPAAEVLGTARMPAQGEPTPDQLEAWRSKLNAQALVFGRLQRNGSLFQLDLDLYRSGQRTRLKTLTGSEPSALAGEAGDIVAQTLSPRQRGQASAQARISADPYINETYARALDAMARERYDEAQNLLRIVVGKATDSLAARVDFADALLSSGYGEEAESQAIRVEKAAIAKGDPSTLARAYIVASMAAQKLGDLARAEAYAGKALALATPDFPEIEPVAQQQLGYLASERGQQTEARRLTEAAIVGFQSMGSKYRLAAAYSNLGMILKRNNDHNAANRHYEHALELARETGRSGTEATILTDLAALQYEAGDCKRAHETLDAALQLARETGKRDQESRVHIFRTDCLSTLGRMDEALAETKKAEALAVALDQPNLIANALMTRANLLGMLPDPAYDDMIALYEKSAGLYEQHGNLADASGTWMNLAQTELGVERFSEAERSAAKAEALARRVENGVLVATSYALRSIIANRRENTDQALMLMLQARAASAENSRVWVESTATAAWHQLESGKIADAEQLLASVARQEADYVSLCIVTARLSYEQHRYQAALDKQDACLKQLEKQAADSDRAIRDVYAAAKATGEHRSLPEGRPSMLWL